MNECSALSLPKGPPLTFTAAYVTRIPYLPARHFLQASRKSSGKTIMLILEGNMNDTHEKVSLLGPVYVTYAYVVRLCLLVLMLTTSALTCLQHSSNHVQAMNGRPVQ